jgi:hypothetical protein
MAKQQIDQETQIGRSDVYQDDLNPGAPLQNDAKNLRDDLNAKRTQLRRIIHGSNAGHWYDDPATVYGADISLQALFYGGRGGFNEDQILVQRDATICVSACGNVLRRK